SERLGTSGRASGIALFDNGNAMGLVLAELSSSDGDVAIFAQTKFFKAGAFDENAWGPSVHAGSTGVSTKDASGHAGLNAHDFLKKALEAPAPAMPGGGITL